MTTSLDKKAPSPFGTLLKRWRRIRGISQLGLAYLSNTSPRHISFIETGRARPGKELILELATALHLPHRDVNEFMRASGFPPLYFEDSLSQSEEMAPYLQLVHNIVHSNVENPCFVIDRWWRMQDANFPMRCLFAEMGTTYEIPDKVDVIDRILGNEAQSSIMINYGEVARQFLIRLRSEVSMQAGDNVIEKFVLKAESKIKFLAAIKDEIEFTSLPLVMKPRYRLGNEIFSAISSVSKFGSAPHVELSELRIVWLCPADEQSRSLLARLLIKHKSLNPSS